MLTATGGRSLTASRPGMRPPQASPSSLQGQYGLISVIGLDPGDTTGLCFLDWVQQVTGPATLVKVTLLQARADSVSTVLEAMIRTWYSGPDVIGRFAQVERFVTGQSAGARGRPANVTRQLVMELTECCQLGGYQASLRNAAVAKDWATDRMLKAAGITRAGDGVHGKARDGYDAARHALYCSVWDAGMKNPLIGRRAASSGDESTA